MNLIEIIITGIGLAMDAFTVSVSKGISNKNLSKKNGIKISLYFGIFQMMMPLLGYFISSSINTHLEKLDHWIVFFILTGIGFMMMIEKEEEENNKVDRKTMIPLAIATSIDAFAIGVTFSFLKVSLLKAVIIIGIITFLLSYIGFILGNKLGKRKKSKTIGGLLIIGIGLKILLEHLM